MPYYLEHEKFHVAVDSIIFGYDEEGRQLKVLLLKRNFQPSKGEWSLMGGFLKNDESVNEAAKRILQQLTGLSDVYMEQLYTFGELDRDPGARIISVAYFALIKINASDLELVKNHGATWIPITSVPTLIFDHSAMIARALKKLQIRARTQPIGFELLPDKFTIPQLQGLYEAIYNKSLDKRNFRRKLLSMDLLEKLEEKEKESSRKGAWYYRFDQKKYEDLLNRGFNFEL
ncbi:MAG: DNA mismatch repair protein MutT [Bacteroidetes bacterium GWB2_41_8]|nr:MAG: DNA mismatch repair protein MutT [Bacteroidetes bacterium GWB2_41_8]